MPGSITAAPAYALHQTLPRIDELAATVLDVHRERHPDLAVLRSAVLELRADLEPHLMKEELVLFPARREVGIATGPVHLPFGSVRNPVGMLMREHDTTGVMLSGLQAHLAEHPLPDGACASYTTLYRALASRPGRDVDQRVLRKTVLVAVDHEPAGTMEDHEENVDLTVHVLGDRLTRVQPDDVDIQVRRFGRGPVHPLPLAPATIAARSTTVEPAGGCVPTSTVVRLKMHPELAATASGITGDELVDDNSPVGQLCESFRETKVDCTHRVRGSDRRRLERARLEHDLHTVLPAFDRGIEPLSSHRVRHEHDRVGVTCRPTLASLGRPMAHSLGVIALLEHLAEQQT
ncbi:MAG TPA: hemerythrin domain-containing protein [Acidimicrobiia bacterium]|nr:hemerythrin domain-containing protein [Acidimicrobiia bacterium]